ncbi:MAG: SDR family oxidoreductase [Hyphomicrobiales bacterium]|nr:SDR family oxidoreductase [Hyphomicrobiales bacterium]
MNDAINRVVLITGAGSGIGAALARRLASAKAGLLLHSRGEDDAGRERLRAVAKFCGEQGARVEIVFGNLGETGVGANAVAKALDVFGRLDQIVHNAGFADRRRFTELTRDDLEASLRAMAGAFLEIVSAASRSLSASRRGRVVVVSSFVAHRFREGELFAASAAAKAALEALAKSLAVELAATRTTVNIVVPGFTRKDKGKLGALPRSSWDEMAKRNPQQRLALPDEIAAAIAFLLSDEAAHITGATLPVDGGLTLG